MSGRKVDLEWCPDKNAIDPDDIFTFNNSEDNLRQVKTKASFAFYTFSETAVTSGSAGALVATFTSKAPHVLLTVDGAGGKEYDNITGPGIVGQLITIIPSGGTVTLDGGAGNINTVGATLALPTTANAVLQYGLVSGEWDVKSSSDNDNT